MFVCRSRTSVSPVVYLVLLLLAAAAGCSTESRRPSIVLPSAGEPPKESHISDAHRVATPGAAELGAGEFLRDGQSFSQTSQLNSAALTASGLAPMEIDVQSYDLTGFFDWDAMLFRGEVLIDLILVSDLGNVLALDSAVRHVTAVKLPDGKALPFQIDQQYRKLIIEKTDLPQDLQVTGSRIRISVSYTTGAGNTIQNNGASQSSVTLYAIGPREDDPVKSRVYYSTAEPLGAASWMPCHNTPSDRARFSTRFTMPSDERLIANGQLVEETVDTATNSRTMAYATQYTIPTYLMAFAVGQFQVSQIQYGGLPLAVWSREGLGVDAGKVLEMVRSSIQHIEKLLVPFPFEKYAVVMLPQFPAGGIEHASISFQAENRSTEAFNVRDFGLTAHELAHQWFGDFVTVQTWDDLWIKEGMATLLAAEVARPYEDRFRFGQFFGHNFGFAKGEAMRDTALPPNQKYNSGPYSRAAWFFNQLRAATGNERFWEILRTFIKEHAFSAVGTNDLLQAFKPALSDEQFKVAQSAIDAQAVPWFSKESGGYKLEDPAGTLIVPLEFRIRSHTGTEYVKYIGKGQMLQDDELAAVSGAESYVVYDPQGVHPDLSDFGEAAPSLVPKEAGVESMTLVNEYGPLAALRHLRELEVLRVTEADFDSGRFNRLLGAMGSDQARFLLVQRACAGFEASGGEPARVVEQMAAIFDGLPYQGQSAALGLLRGCLTADLQAQRMGDLRSAAATGQTSATELGLAHLFLAGQSQARTLWEKVAVQGRSVRLRGAALAALAYDLNELIATGGLVTDQQLQHGWVKTIQAVLENSGVSENVGSALGLARAFAKVSPESGPALAGGFGVMLSKQLPSRASLRVVCVAQKVVGNEQFAKLVEEAAEGPNGSLAARVVEDGALCDTVE